MKLNKKGFTLIELVIVIIIIAILAAVAIPRFRDLAVHARGASERATVTAVRQAITIYRVENELAGITPIFPAVLDDAPPNTDASDANPFFTKIMEVGGEVRSGWRKNPVNALIYIGPADGIFTYNPVDGNFVPVP